MKPRTTPPKAPGSENASPLRPASLVAVAAAALLVYSPSFAFEWSGLDDVNLCIADAPALRSESFIVDAWTRPHFPAAELARVYYRPVVSLSYAFDARASGPDTVAPAPFHRTNVILHILAGLLLTWTASLLGLGATPSLITGLLFVVHPLPASAVSWIPGRNDLLLAIFALLALSAFVRANDQGRPRPYVDRLLHGAAFALALFTKESAAAIPAICVGYLAMVRGLRGRSLVPSWLVAAWGGPVAIYLPLRIRALGGLGEDAGGGVSALIDNITVLPASLGKAILPVGLSVVSTRVDAPLFTGLVALALVIAAGVAVSRESRSRFLFFCLAAVAILAPSLAAQNELTLENRLYLPVGFMMLAIVEAAGALIPRSIHQAAIGLGIFLAVAAVRYQQDFRNPDAFSRATVEGAPRSARSHLNRGRFLHDEGRADEAFAEYEKAIALDPAFPTVRNNMAVLLIDKGQTDRAEVLLNEEIALGKRFAPAYLNLARLLRNRGRDDDAATLWTVLLEVQPDNIDALGELMAHYSSRDPAQASAYRKRLESIGLRFIESPP